MAEAHHSEVWRDHPGKFKGILQASSLGRIRTIDRLYLYQGGPKTGIRKGKILTLADNRGYLKIAICVNGKKYSLAAHRIVAECFHGPQPPGKQVDHKNHARTDNRPENLRWVTPSENIIHGAKHGNIKIIGADNCKAKLSDEDVLAIMHRIADGEYLPDIAKSYGVHASSIMRIRQRKSWTHLDPGTKVTSGMAKQTPPWPHLKIDENKVRQIKHMIKTGLSDREIATKFNVRYGTIWKIRHRKSWRHIK